MVDFNDLIPRRTPQDSLRFYAKKIGADPLDLANVITYETAGTFSPRIRGGEGNRHIGLIQFGPEERARYGADPEQDFDTQMGAVANYLVDRGYRPGMNIYDLYSTINAGRPRRYSASDRPGATVYSHVQEMLGGHRNKAEAWLGSGEIASSPSPVVGTAADSQLTGAFIQPAGAGAGVPSAVPVPAPEVQPTTTRKSDYGAEALAQNVEETQPLSFEDLIPIDSEQAIDFSDLIPEEKEAKPRALGSIVRGVAQGLSSIEDALTASGWESPETNVRRKKKYQSWIEAAPPPPEAIQFAKDYEKVEGAGGLLSLMASNPSGAASFMGEASAMSYATGVPSMVLGTAAGGAVGGPPGAIGGFATGAFSSSLVTEYSSNLTNFLTEKGFDLSTEEGWNHALANPAIMSEAKEYSLKKGLPVAAFDTLTSFLGAKGFGRATVNVAEKVIGKTIAGNVTRNIAEGTANTILLEAPGGAFGSAASNIAVGEDINTRDMMAEAMGEIFFGGVPEAAMAVALSHQQRTTAPSRFRLKQAASTTLDPNQVELLQTPYEEAVRQGRTWFGAVDEKGNVGVMTNVYEDAEVAYGMQLHNKGGLIAARSEDVVADMETAINVAETAPNNVMFKGKEADSAIVDKVKALTDEKSYRTLVDEGLRVAARPGRPALYIGNIQNDNIAPKLEAPIQGEKIISRDNNSDTGAPRKFGVDVDLLTLSKNEKVVLAPTKRLLSTIRAYKFGEKLFKSLFTVNDPDLQNILQTEDGQGGWQGLLDHLYTLDKSVVKHPILDSVFREGKIILHPNSFILNTALNGSISVLGKDKTTSIADLDEEIEKAVITSGLSPAPAYTMFGKTSPSATTLNYPFLPYLTGGKDPNIEAMPGVAQEQDGITVIMSTRAQNDTRIKRAVDAAVSVIRKFNKATGRKTDTLIIVGGAADAHELSNKLSSPNGRPEVDDFLTIKGSFFNPSNSPTNPSLIRIDSGAGFGLYTTIMHEFGHAISYSMLWEQTPEIQAQIWGAYRRYRQTTDALGGSEDINTQVANFIIAKANNVDLTQLSGISRDYYLSFEEWFAEQIARWASSSRKPMSQVAKFFRSVATRLRNLFKMARKANPGADFYASPEVDAWASAVYSGEVPNFSLRLRQMFEPKTALENFKRSGVKYPLQPETAHMSNLIKKYAEPLKQMRAVAQTMGLPPVAPPETLKTEMDRYNFLSKFFLNFRQVAQKNPYIVELQLYGEYIERMQLEANQIMMAADARLREWRNLRRKTYKGLNQADALNNFLYAMNAMTYLDSEERRRGIRRWPTQKEFEDLVTFHRMSDEALEVYTNIRADFDMVIQRQEELALTEAARTHASPQEQAETVIRIKELSARLRAAPYFPITRFGRWAVTTRNAAGHLLNFETYETEREQKRAAEEIRKEFKADFTVTSTLPEDVTHFQGMPTWFLDKLKDMPGVSESQKVWIDQLRFEMSPENSFRKHMIRRRMVAGYSKQGERSYARYFFQHSRNYARIKYQKEAKDAINAIRNSNKILQNIDVNKRTQLADYMDNHLEEIMNPAKDWSVLRSIAAVFHLGFNVSSAALNMTQVPVITAPYLATRFGDAKALSALTRAYADLKTFYKRGTYKGQTDLESRAMQWLVDHNLITESMAAELAAISTGGNLNAPGFSTTKVQRTWHNISHWAMAVFQAVEQMNRRVTGRAAFRLALENKDAPHLIKLRDKYFLTYRELTQQLGFNHTEAIALLAAKEAILETQYDYSKAARPRFMRGRLGALFVFYSYTQNTVFQLMRKENRGMLIRYAILMTVLAGPAGLVPDDVEDVLNYVASKAFGRRWNMQNEIREFVYELTGSADAADWALHGVGRYSFGIPALMDSVGVSWWPSFDSSHQMAISRISPIAATTMLQPSADYNKLVSDTTQNVAGAAFGLGMNGLQVLLNNELSWGDPKRWERAMPTAIKRVTQAMRMYSAQGMTDKKGNVTLPFDRNDPQEMAELAGYALGYTPTRMAVYREQMREKYEVQAYWDIHRALLLDEAYRNRIVNQDKDAFASTLEAIKEFNRNVPDPKRRISRDTLRRSAKFRLGRAAGLREGVDKNIAPGVARQIEQLYPDMFSAKKVDAVTLP
jgi:hypothetical protein